MTRLVSGASKQGQAYAQNIHDDLTRNHVNDSAPTHEVGTTPKWGAAEARAHQACGPCAHCL